MDLSFTHLHLLLNHVPTVGAVAAVGLLLLAFVRRNEHLQHVGLEALVIIAVVTVPVYASGVAAYRVLREMPEVSNTAMLMHQDAALYGFTLVQVAGFLAWLALWFRRRGEAARGTTAAATLLAVVALAVMARAAALGGEIRHPEIRTTVPAEGQQFIAAAISSVMVNSRWVWPAAEAIHFLGLSLSLGILLAVNLRILGAMRQVSFEALHRLLPWGMLGLGVNLITGMMFFVGQPGQYIESAPFYWKLLFLAIAGLNFLYLTVFRKPWGDRFDSTLADKAMAVSSIAAWLGVLVAGRMLPFLGSAF
jgi:hypothetical protein